MDTVSEWVLSMERRGLSPATIYRRRRCIELLYAEFGALDVTTEEVEWFLDRRDLSTRTRYGWISHLGAYYVWAVRFDRIARNPVARLQRPKLGRLVPHPTPEREVAAAISAAPTEPLRQWVTLMAFAGLRCCEVAALEGSNVDFDTGRLRVTGKFQKERSVPMHPAVRVVLQGCAQAGPVFIDPGTGAPYHPQRVSRLIGLHMRAVGATHVRAHRLRHRFATVLLRSGVDIAVVAELLGHESIETTRGYSEVGFDLLERAVAMIA